MTTYFQDFVRDNGTPVTVEYAVEGSYSPDTYTPMHGADGGDAPTFSIINAWPNTPWHERLAGISLRLRFYNEKHGALTTLRVLTGRAIWALMRFDEWLRASLTDAEYERFEAYLAEHYVEEPYEPDWDYP